MDKERLINSHTSTTEAAREACSSSIIASMSTLSAFLASLHCGGSLLMNAEKRLMKEATSPLSHPFLANVLAIM